MVKGMLLFAQRCHSRLSGIFLIVYLLHKEGARKILDKPE
jgi:hypothetical protein